ncbi:MAG: hypothetical protein GY909_09280 [Oligoflexia bacterium]|nr:hypothetical protein [Oligoflexia bacterium]
MNKKLVVTPIVFLVILGILIYKNTRSELLYKKDIYVESVITAKSKKQVELSKQTIEKEEESEKDFVFDIGKKICLTKEASRRIINCHDFFKSNNEKIKVFLVNNNKEIDDYLETVFSRSFKLIEDESNSNAEHSKLSSLVSSLVPRLKEEIWLSMIQKAVFISQTENLDIDRINIEYVIKWKKKL